MFLIYFNIYSIVNPLMIKGENMNLKMIHITRSYLQRTTKILKVMNTLIKAHIKDFIKIQKLRKVQL